jgi:hypothetical protein
VMRKMLLEQLSRPSEPITRLELWLGVITVYLVLSAFLMGHLSTEMGAAEKSSVTAVSDRA